MILVINGPNLNMLGIREKNLYGNENYKSPKKFIKDNAKLLKLKVKLYQSNYEGDIISVIQKAYKKYTGIIINAGAYTHTSIGILDALKSVNIPTCEVHLTDIDNREEFRKHSYISLFAEKIIVGKGFNGYKEALEYFANK